MADKFMYNFKLYFKLLHQYGEMDLKWFLRDTKYCIATVIADLISGVSAVLSVFLLSERFGNIGGMNSKQILFMLGYAAIIDGLYTAYLGMNNIGFISRIIGRGQMDHKLIQPVPIWMQFATEGFVPISGSSMLFWGIGLTIYSANQLNLTVTPIWLLWFVVNIFCSVVIIFAISTLFGTAAFYAPVAAEEVSTTVLDFFNSVKSYPIGGLPYGIQIVLCTMLPSGLTAWLPANILLGQTPSGFSPVLVIGIAIGLSIATSFVFKKGLNYYGKYGSTRYHNRGHRS